MGTQLPLSVAIITSNEEQRLAACLESLAGKVREIVVVDSGSSDRTLAIAADFGARIFSHEWQGFGRQKQFAIDQCTSDWILVLDADERLPEETAAAIADALATAQHAAYSFPRKNIVNGRWIRHGGWWPDRVVRLFRRGRGRMSAAPVHESLIIDGSTGEIGLPLLHCSVLSLSRTLEKIDRYSTIGAGELAAAGRSTSVYAAFFRGMWAFFHGYVLRLGLLDGEQGLLIAATDGMNTFCKYAKLRERRWRQPPDSGR